MYFLSSLYRKVGVFYNPRFSANKKTESQKVQVTPARGHNIPIVALELNSDSQLHTASASLVAQAVERLPAMQETQVGFLGREDSLEKEMAIHSSTLAWKIPWMEKPDRLQS